VKTRPKCRGCYKEAVPADAGILRSIPYWYCRVCKVEVDEYGREVYPAPREKAEGLDELDDYLSGEVDRFDNLQGDDVGSGLVTAYDPFLKRSRRMSLKDAQRMNARPTHKVQEEDDCEDEDEEVLGFWDPSCLPDSF